MHRWTIRRLVVLVVGLLAASAGAGAQGLEPAPELVTDRPDFTESTVVIARGFLQVETGFTYEREETGDVRVSTVTVPQLLVRLGVSQRLELRLATDGIVSAATGRTRVTGMADLETGVKIHLFDQEHAGVDVAILPLVSWPTGNAAVTSEGVDPTLKVAWARDLPAGFGVSGNYNVASLSDPIRRFTQETLSFSFSHNLVAGLDSYIETYGFMPMERDSRAGWTIDFGASRIVHDNLQFDVEGGRGITDAAPNWFVGFGFAIRGRVIHP
jgi:hypothetical protein